MGKQLLLSDILGTDEDVIYRDIETDVERSLLMTAIAGLTGRERMIINCASGLNTAGGGENAEGGGGYAGDFPVLHIAS